MAWKHDRRAKLEATRRHERNHAGRIAGVPQIPPHVQARLARGQEPSAQEEAEAKIAIDEAKALFKRRAALAEHVSPDPSEVLL